MSIRMWPIMQESTIRRSCEKTAVCLHQQIGTIPAVAQPLVRCNAITKARKSNGNRCAVALFDWLLHVSRESSLFDPPNRGINTAAMYLDRNG